jgi:antitoxin CptB
METQRKRLIYRSKHRGCKETDILLGKNAEEFVEKLDKQGLDLYEEYLNESDNDIYNWLAGIDKMPDKYLVLYGK